MRIELDVPEGMFAQMLGAVEIPRFAAIHQDIPTPPPLPDPAGEVRRLVLAAPEEARFRPGERVAIGVGSRGIACLPEMVSALVEAIKTMGAEPFIVPSMGSHGGATAAGQREVLAHLGVTEESAGAPIISSMETVLLGRTEEGAPVYLDRAAAEADAITVIARIKPHTAFRGPYESGLAKMIAIGLGKQAGAAATHARGFGQMARMVPAMARIALERAPIRLAVGVLENARDEPFKVVAVPAERIMQDEPALLEEARRAMPRLPFEQLDVLVIDRIGKNISGDGADPNITGRYPTPDASGGPDVNKQVVLDLAAASLGNANGVGTADFTTVRLARKMDLAATYPNALTSTVPRPVALPMVLPSDRMALAAAILTCHAVDRPPRVARIVDTLHLERLWISEALLAEAGRNSCVSMLSGSEPLPFDRDGNLTDLGREPGV